MDYIPIKTVEDIANLTPEQFERFHTDLKDWYVWQSSLVHVNKMAGVSVVLADRTLIKWVDDGQRRAIINVQPVNEAGERIGEGQQHIINFEEQEK